MDGLISFLLFVIFLYLMMRFSCVAYMAKFRHIHFSADKAKLIIEPIYEKVFVKMSLRKGR
jgi:hypothetical protein